MHDAFVLAAGFGTRLRPLTYVRPKPLVPVCGVPLLAYNLALCARHGLTDVVVNAHYLAEQLRPWQGEHEGVRVTLSVEEPEILGTGGGLKKVAGDLAERFVVVNGDVLSDVDLAALRAAVPPGGAAMALREREYEETYGPVAADASGAVVQLVDLAEAPAEGEVDASTHFTGLHAMDRAVLERVPEGFACIVRTAYRELVPERAVRALRHDGVWLDVGTPAAYWEANFAVLDGRVATPLDPFARAGWARQGGQGRGDASLVEAARITGDAWIGEGSVLEPGARVSHSIVGAGATLRGGAEVVDCVVWDGVTVERGRYQGAVIHPEGVIYVK